MAVAQHERLEPLPRPGRRRITLWEEQIRQFIDLPAHFRINAVVASYDPNSIVLIVESYNLAETPPQSPAPLMEGTWDRETVEVDGKFYYRWGWSPKGEV